MARACLIVFGNSQLRRKKALETFRKIKPGFESEKDPDTQILEGASIKLEEVKNLKHLLSLKPYQSAPRVAIIYEAQNLTGEAQRALLPLLSEEKGQFILTTPTPEALLPGIGEACQVKRLPLEPEIRLEKGEKALFEKKLKTLLAASYGKRLKAAEEITSREEAVLFCQKMLVLTREDLLKSLKSSQKSAERLKLIKDLQKTLKMLASNVNHRLAIENLFLELPRVQ